MKGYNLTLFISTIAFGVREVNPDGLDLDRQDSLQKMMVNATEGQRLISWSVQLYHQLYACVTNTGYRGSFYLLEKNSFQELLTNQGYPAIGLLRS